jgi:two-component system CheB/CheR fusion protein
LSESVAEKVLIEKESSFPVVGIGASAGGVEAVTELFRYLPPDIGMAFIYIQHLAPKQESMLAEIVSRSTQMKVQTAEDDVKIEPNNVYVTPPAAVITLENGRLKLNTKSEKFHYPIDSFPVSLAQEYKTRAIGIILSGTGTDGTEGLRAIYAEGGVTIVQQVDSARYRDMPSSALDQGVVHFALPPEEIAKRLVAISTHPYIAQGLSTVEVKEERDYKTITSLIKLKYGIDFSKYKESTIGRRISRRMLIRRVEKLSDYITLLKTDPDELLALHNDMLIGVTNFFREPETFKALVDRILPEILIRKKAEEAIRVWVPGCATGEEAYSVAICIREVLEVNSKAFPVQVFGTDISQKYVEKAREGVYAENISIHVSEDRLNKFFHKTNGDYQVNKVIRDVCVFSKHDLTRDPPFSNLDLIFCRNVLIYLKGESQERILNLFHYGLKKTGFLVLGHSESVGKAESLFIRKEDSIYVKREVQTKTP